MRTDLILFIRIVEIPSSPAVAFEARLLMILSIASGSVCSKLKGGTEEGFKYGSH